MTNPPHDGDERDAGNGAPQADPDQQLTQPVQPYDRSAPPAFPPGPPAQQYGQPAPGSARCRRTRPGPAPVRPAAARTAGLRAAGYGQPPYGQPGYGQPGYGPGPYAQARSRSRSRTEPPTGRSPTVRPGSTTPGPARPGRRSRTSGSTSGWPRSSCCSPSRWCWRTSSARRSWNRAAVERDVAEQFEEREGVAIDLTCDEEMRVETGRVLPLHRRHRRRRRGRTADHDHRRELRRVHVDRALIS